TVDIASGVVSNAGVKAISAFLGPDSPNPISFAGATDTLGAYGFGGTCGATDSMIWRPGTAAPTVIGNLGAELGPIFSDSGDWFYIRTFDSEAHLHVGRTNDPVGTLDDLG